MTDCSEAARDAIEKLGGKVELIYHNRVSLRYTTKPEKFYLKPTFARYATLHGELIILIFFHRPPPKIHRSKYPNFPEPTPFTATPDVIEDITYSDNFDAERKAEKKKRYTIFFPRCMF